MGRMTKEVRRKNPDTSGRRRLREEGRRRSRRKVIFAKRLVSAKKLWGCLTEPGSPSPSLSLGERNSFVMVSDRLRLATQSSDRALRKLIRERVRTPRLFPCNFDQFGLVWSDLDHFDFFIFSGREFRERLKTIFNRGCDERKKTECRNGQRCAGRFCRVLHFRLQGEFLRVQNPRSKL